MDAYERALIAEALAGQDGNVAAAADRLGIPKKTLYDKLKKYQLSSGRAPD
ncbi:helix-turn-helix domain-containing protein [Noviherbaspirillum denitrificans]|uniref:helix-turn-helix domain-containing protein n=1 Tax=Noviherbaspirillum denitrificans TaxID=1968433 RepID=UPI0030788F24